MKDDINKIFEFAKCGIMYNYPRPEENKQFLKMLDNIENHFKNLSEAGTGYALLSDVIDQINKSNDMLKDIYCNVDLPKSLYTKDNDIRDRIDANTVILNKCKEYLRQ